MSAKVCIKCGDQFVPHPRLGDRQRTCGCCAWAADYAEDMTRELRRLLEKTDARDSLAFLEAKR